MRAADQPVPVVVLDDATSFAGRPVRPVIAFEQAPPYRWDDGVTVWEGGPTPAIWDAPYAAWVDATCSFTGLEIATGDPDDRALFPAGRAVIQLDNRDGTWSQFNADGSPVAFGPGTRVAIWAHTAAADYWLFAGSVASWDQRADDTIEVEAFDVFSDLAQSIATFTPGVAGEHPGPRLTAIVAAANMAGIPTRFATGVVALTRQPTDNEPLEEMQAVAGSDGGLIYV